jgi:hypothetical protein
MICAKSVVMSGIVLFVTLSSVAELTYPIVDSGQTDCYNASTFIRKRRVYCP